MKKARIQIRIAYTWESANARADQRWLELSEFVRKYAEVGLGRLIGSARDVVEIESSSASDLCVESPKTVLDRAPVYVSVERLRATAGDWTWNSIVRKLRDTDILICDLAIPSARDQVSNNVFLELGAYIGAEADVPRRWFITTNEEGGHANLPSDLHGQLVGMVRKDHHDQSLAMALAYAVRDCGLAKI